MPPIPRAPRAPSPSPQPEVAHNPYVEQIAAHHNAIGVSVPEAGDPLPNIQGPIALNPDGTPVLIETHGPQLQNPDGTLVPLDRVTVPDHNRLLTPVELHAAALHTMNRDEAGQSLENLNNARDRVIDLASKAEIKLWGSGKVGKDLEAAQAVYDAEVDKMDAGLVQVLAEKGYSRKQIFQARLEMRALAGKIDNHGLDAQDKAAGALRPKSGDRPRGSSEWWSDKRHNAKVRTSRFLSKKIGKIAVGAVIGIASSALIASTGGAAGVAGLLGAKTGSTGVKTLGFGTADAFVARTAQSETRRNRRGATHDAWVAQGIGILDGTVPMPAGFDENAYIREYSPAGHLLHDIMGEGNKNSVIRQNRKGAIKSGAITSVAALGGVGLAELAHVVGIGGGGSDGSSTEAASLQENQQGGSRTGAGSEMTPAEKDAQAAAAASDEASADTTFGNRERHFQRTSNGTLWGLEGAADSAERFQLTEQADGKYTLQIANTTEQRLHSGEPNVGKTVIRDLRFDPNDPKGGFDKDSAARVSEHVKLTYVGDGDSESEKGRWDMEALQPEGQTDPTATPQNPALPGGALVDPSTQQFQAQQALLDKYAAMPDTTVPPEVAAQAKANIDALAQGKTVSLAEIPAIQAYIESVTDRSVAGDPAQIREAEQIRQIIASAGNNPAQWAAQAAEVQAHLNKIQELAAASSSSE